ncbi:MAG TPA: protein kinase [Gemmatimonadaceae bacterium]|nr:protein kinase [Gemmatimonadaceae bacterium]
MASASCTPMTQETTFARALAGRYTIERQLGHGGAATVYLADDVRHRRKVAIKVLRPELAAMLGAERFLREIEIAASLTHPHILPLFDSGEVEGVPYYVMPFVPGESLRDMMIRLKQLPVDDAVRIASQVGAALSFAHDKGVLHRDIKPDNVLMAHNHALLADFGIARAIDVSSNERLTMVGIAVGTPAYISPEQAAGDPNADARSDLYSLGCVVYEMLTGQPPFTGTTVQSIIAKRFLEKPAPVTTLRDGIPIPVAVTVMRSIEREAIRRFSSVDEFVKSLNSDVTVSRDQMRAHQREGTSREHSIAVLPFTSMSTDQETEYFADGMTEDLISALSTVPSMRVPARTTSFAYKRSTEDVRSVGHKLGVASVLEGSIRRVGNRLRVTAQLINVSDGFNLWSERYDREMKDVFEIQDEISAAIVNTVKGKLMTGELPVARQHNPDFEAYRLYLQGRYYWNQRDLGKAIHFFEQAIAKDPEYAIAHCGLADTYCALGLYGLVPTELAYARAKASVDQAMEVDDTSAEVHYSRGLIQFFFGWDFEEAVGAFEDAIARNPAMAGAHSYLSAVSGMIGDEVRALDSGPRAQELEPLSPLISTSASMGYYLLGRLELTKVACQQALTIDPQHNTADYLLALVDVAQGRHDEGIARMRQTAERMKRIPHILMFLGEVLWKSGHKDEARAVLVETYERCAKGVDRPAAKAWLHLQMGELDKGFEQLELGASQHDPAVPFLLSWPGIGHVREDPRYGDLLDKLRLTRYATVWQRRN